MSRTKAILITVSIMVLSISPSFAGWKENAKAIDISGGEDHTLVLTKNKSVWACGPNGSSQYPTYYGVLGTGSTSAALIAKTLVRVWDGDMNTPSDYLEDINDVDAGWKHSLALESYDQNDPNYNGYVWAWGWNSEGQLGDNQDNFYETTPVQVLRGEQAPADPNDPDSNLARIIDISAGRSGEHSLAADVNGYAYAWGYNEYGQCGNGQSENNKLTPVHVSRGAQPLDPKRSSEDLNRIIAVSAGEWHSMGLERYDPCDPNMDGRVYTWGDNAFGTNRYGRGVLGDGTDVLESTTPVIVLSGEQDPNNQNTSLKHIVAISAGWDHSMALEKYEAYDYYRAGWDPCYTGPDPNHKGRVYTWGNNENGYDSVGGRLGDGSITSSSTPVVVLRGEQQPEDPCNPDPNLARIVAVSAGEGHSMALDVDGSVYTWGDNQHGQLGDGTDEQRLTPVRVVGEDGVGDLENIVAIAAGYWHSVAVDANGTIWTWGKGSDGRLGLGNKTIDCTTPYPIPVVYNITQETFAFAIQATIDDANNVGDTLEASPGTYYEDVDFLTKTITLRSADPNNADVVEDTVIQGSGSPGVPAVKFTANPNSILDGLTIANNDYGIKCDSSSPTISNNVIANCGGHGLYCLGDSRVEVKNCTISGNGAGYSEDGINCSSSEIILSNCLITANVRNGIYCNGSSLGLTNSIIEDNGGYGIYELYPTVSSVIANNIIRGNAGDGIYSGPFSSGPEIANNWIYSNGGSGIVTYNDDSVPGPDSNAVIVNNTIVNNNANGVMSYYAVDAEITSSIISNNGSNPSDNLHATNGTFDVAYSCIEGGYGGTGNIDGDPCFVDADANDFHLDANSPCIDSGDPGFEADANETDIDGEERVINERVDMGADEFYWSVADVNGNGLVNFVDYAVLAGAWGTDANDANYIEVCDLDDDNIIDFKDIKLFCDEWLWEAGWRAGAMPLTAGRSAEGMVEGLRLEAAPYEFAAAKEKPPGAEPVDVKGLLDWLAEIWLDPDVQKVIDAEDWLKLYESLKDLE